MNYALILAAGVGQRMRNSGMPKQFLKVNGKPIIIYTLEKFDEHPNIDGIVVVCKEGYVDYMNMFIEKYNVKKIKSIIVGGKDRQASLHRGLKTVLNIGANENDVVLIHDGVRPLVSTLTINENIRVTKECGAAMTVHPVTESVVVTSDKSAGIVDFKMRAQTYSLTSPQSFKLGEILKAYDLKEREANEKSEDETLPLLDAAMVYAKYKGDISMVKESNTNIKITTPEDYYVLRSMFEMEENKFIFGL